MSMYKLFIDSHIVFSSLFFVLAFYVVGRMIYKLVGKKEYKTSDYKMSLVYLVFLYMQFITGIILYFFLKPELTQSAMSVDEAINNSQLRFWVLEHLASMMFALMLSQIGWVLIKNSSSSIKKFRNTIFYYGVSLIIIVISTSIALVKEGII